MKKFRSQYVLQRKFVCRVFVSNNYVTINLIYNYRKLNITKDAFIVFFLSLCMCVPYVSKYVTYF